VKRKQKSEMGRVGKRSLSESTAGVGKHLGGWEGCQETNISISKLRSRHIILSEQCGRGKGGEGVSSEIHQAKRRKSEGNGGEKSAGARAENRFVKESWGKENKHFCKGIDDLPKKQT